MTSGSTEGQSRRAEAGALPIMAEHTSPVARRKEQQACPGPRAIIGSGSIVTLAATMPQSRGLADHHRQLRGMPGARLEALTQDKNCQLTSRRRARARRRWWGHWREGL